MSRLYALAAALAAFVVVLLAGFAIGAATVKRDWDAQKALDAAQIASMKAAHAKALADTKNALEAQLAESKTRHEEIQSKLRSSLRSSPLRSCRVPADIVRMHDDAAGADTPAPAASDPPGPTGEAATAADLAEACLVNYEIAERNAERLAGWQSWWQAVSSVGVK